MKGLAQTGDRRPLRNWGTAVGLPLRGFLRLFAVHRQRTATQVGRSTQARHKVNCPKGKRRCPGVRLGAPSVTRLHRPNRRGEHCSPAKKHKITFLLLALLSDQKRGKSHLRGFSILLKNTFRVHELVARAVRGECVRQRTERKSVVLRSPQSHTTTRANTSHEKAEQIRARIVCTPAISARRAWV